MAGSVVKPSTHAYRGPVRRLRVAVSDGTWRVVKEMRVERMSVRAHWSPPEGRGLEVGNYVEVIDSEGRVLHRQPVRDPLDTSIEIFDRGRISRVDTKREILLDILAPEPKKARRVRLVAHGRDLPLAEGKKKPHTRGFELPALK